MIRVLAPLACLVAAMSLGAGSAASDTCPTSNAPNTLKLVAGTLQTAQLEHQFQANFHVALANTNGCAVTGSLAGVTVKFAAPSSGASGVFASTGTTVAYVGTDANGDANAPAFTANDTAGTYGVVGESDFGSVRFSLANTTSGLAASITATEGGGQSVSVGATYASPLQVQVLDAGGNPVQGATVTFAVGTGASGASASFAGGGAQVSVTTNSAGRATSPALVANASSGPFTAMASTTGLGTVATFALDNHAAALAISASSTAVVTATVGKRYAAPLQAQVRDAADTPVEGATVTFAIQQATAGPGASFVGGATQATAVTDANGRATSPALVANTTAGTFTATATVSGGAAAASYALRNVAGAPATVTAGAATGETATVGTRFPVRLAVTVADASKNAVAGALVTFTAPAHGASGRFGGSRVARVRTDKNGIAVAPPFTANGRVGGYAVIASVSGARAAIALVNTRR
ncbi:MAG TPA: hypothetical protein VFM96_07065 [Gaiellaceae bacterium]|nr:hypothetical protein [Gaiellaceae bacterium]